MILSESEGCKGFEIQRNFMVAVFMQAYGTVVPTLMHG
jgi:hypothetical protein